jgi:pimeloyl-ACP methyl ester carboxylesterase
MVASAEIDTCRCRRSPGGAGTKSRSYTSTLCATSGAGLRQRKNPSREDRGARVLCYHRRKMRTTRDPSRFSARAGVAFAVVALAIVAACDQRRETPALSLADCRLPKLATAARCATLAVPEDRSRPDGRKIDVFVAVLPANSVAPKSDPLVVLAGGPGQAASQLAPLAQRLADVRRLRDIVLIDQRGTGRSSPLACEALKPNDDIEASFEMDSVPKARDCVRELTASGVDLTQYTTEAWVADIDAVRAALGYPRLNLWGGSYGTRVALAYARRHPERLRSMVLDGVAPPEMAVPRDVWASRERALDELLAACAAAETCRARHPDLRLKLDRLERDLATQPRRIEFQDPRTGQARNAVLTFDLVLGGIYALTYAPERAALLPVIIDRAAAGDFGPLLAASQASTGDISEQINPALHYSVICSEDAPRVTDADRQMLGKLRSRTLAANMLEVCALWPKAKPPADAATAVRSDVPTLLLSGGLDPVTPPAAAAAVAATLPNSRQVVAQGAGHIVSAYACVPRMIAAFVESADKSSPAASCVEFLEKTRRSPLWADRLGPAP